MVETLTDEEAGELVRLVLDKLREIGATDLIEGIDESRRLGVEEKVESVPANSPKGDTEDRKLDTKEAKQLGTVRRRPPTDREMLRLVFERVRQRVIVLPAIARALQASLKSSDLSWRVDSQFVPSERSVALEGRLSDFLPDDTSEVGAAYRRIVEMIPDYAPREAHNG